MEKKIWHGEEVGGHPECDKEIWGDGDNGASPKTWVCERESPPVNHGTLSRVQTKLQCHKQNSAEPQG